MPNARAEIALTDEVHGAIGMTTCGRSQKVVNLRGDPRETAAHQARRRVLRRVHPEHTTSWDHRKQ